MDRRNLIKMATRPMLALPILSHAAACAGRTRSTRPIRHSSKQGLEHPLAITMWDFSWIERRWPGAGFEDWDRILNELSERGYNAVRIDAFPHLVASGYEQEWTLVPVWTTQDWGSPALNRICLKPGLTEFIGKCQERQIQVGLSTWYREDAGDVRMQIDSPVAMAEQWLQTLAEIDQQGLLETILYVDLCNEWPGDLWCPFFKNDPPELTWGGWHTERSMRWMHEASRIVQKAHPDLPVSFSFHTNEPRYLLERDISFVDYLDPHIWMSQAPGSGFDEQVSYRFDRFKDDSYNSLAKEGEKLYRSDPAYWQRKLRNHIENVARHAAQISMPLVTTECWGIVDYKDWPLLSWDWIKELCVVGTETALRTGQWVAIATSNFCAPQFVGMWREVQWHRKLTGSIRSAAVNDRLKDSKIARRAT